MVQPETVLVGRIKDAIKSEHPDSLVIKLAGGPYQVAGLPDLLVINEGEVFGFEVKHQKPGESDDHARGRATVRQEAMLARFRAAGAHGSVILSPEEALDAMRS